MNLDFFKHTTKPPMYGQENDSWCGPACVQETIRVLLKKNLKQITIANNMGTTIADGTSQRQMYDFFLKQKLNVHATTLWTLEELKMSVNKKNVVIVDWMAGKDHKEYGHYCLLEDCNKNYVILNNPLCFGSYSIMKRSVFEKQWFDYENGKKVKNWAMVISKK